VDVGDNVLQLSRRERHAGLTRDLRGLERRHSCERVVLGCRAIGVEPEDSAGEVGVIGRRTLN
jgi:hypothetical protein